MEIASNFFGSKKTIGFVCHYSYEIATGGMKYFLNLFRALANLPFWKKPCIFIFHIDETPLNEIKKINYPCIYFVNIANKNFPTVLFDALFTTLYAPEISIQYKKKLIWIADFQHNYYPEFFSKTDLSIIENKTTQVAHGKDIVVLSSHNAKQDFIQFYHPTCPIVILSFSTYLPKYSTKQLPKVKLQYNLPENYIIVSNQFWPHKNHSIVLDALGLLKKDGLEINCVFTGQPVTYRDPLYREKLLHLVETYNISKNVYFLGLIPREDQLCLLDGSVVVVQPSKFEGWSTVVEDCKCIGKFLILSNISVHQEQMLGYDCAYFDPNSPTELANILSVLFHKMDKDKKMQNSNYKKSQLNFSNRLFDVLCK